MKEQDGLKSWETVERPTVFYLRRFRCKNSITNQTLWCNNVEPPTFRVWNDPYLPSLGSSFLRKSTFISRQKNQKRAHLLFRSAFGGEKEKNGASCVCDAVLRERDRRGTDARVWEEYVLLGESEMLFMSSLMDCCGFSDESCDLW